MLEKLTRYWKIYTFLPVVALLLSSAFLVNNMITKGSFMERSPELVGGKIITMQVADPSKIKLQ